jgi:hypothetical protein
MLARDADAFRKNRKRRFSRLLSATLVSIAATGSLMATATPAFAATTDQGVMAQAYSVRSAAVSLPNYGDNIDFRTWIFGTTQLCVENIGGTDGEAKVYAWVTSASEVVRVNPGGTECINRWWGGNLINVSNNSSSPLVVWTR